MTKPVGSHVALFQIDTLCFQQKALEHKRTTLGKSTIHVLHVLRLVKDML